MIVAKYRRAELISNYTILTILALTCILPILLLSVNNLRLLISKSKNRSSVEPAVKELRQRI